MRKTARLSIRRRLMSGYRERPIKKERGSTRPSVKKTSSKRSND